MRQLETLAHSPNELLFKLKQVEIIKGLRKELVMMRLEQRREFRKLASQMMGPIKIAETVRTEFKENKEFNQVKIDVKRLWNGAMVLLACIVSGVVGFMVKNALK